jgi:hypothetical protein
MNRHVCVIYYLFPLSLLDFFICFHINFRRRKRRIVKLKFQEMAEEFIDNALGQIDQKFPDV